MDGSEQRSTEETGEGPLVAAGRRISRRVMLRTGTLGAAAVGVVAAVPGMSGFLQSASSAAPEAPAAAGDASGLAADAGPALDGPIVAHITDASAGDVSVYVGEREVTTRDPALVQHLLNLAR